MNVHGFVPGVSALLLLAIPVTAQYETSPKGLLSTEGTWGSQSTLGYYSKSYGYGVSHLRVDATQTGAARSLTMLSLRRDGEKASDPQYVGRTIAVDIRMGHANWNNVKGNTPQTDAEFMTGPWTTVATDKTVKLPDLANKPQSGTAPFNVQLPLDQPFAYRGDEALAFQILASPNSDLQANWTEYPIDLAYTPNSIGPVTDLGQGCKVGGVTMQVYTNLFNYGPNSTTDWSFDVRNAPVNAAHLLMIGVSDPNLPFGGCESLRTDATVVLTGTTNASGSWERLFKFKHRPEYVGATMFVQTAAQDASQMPIPVALSQGVKVVYPSDPKGQPFATSSKLVHWSSKAWPTENTFWRSNGPVFGLHE